MSKTKKLFDLITYINTKRQFTASDVAKEFKISVRTAHRYLLELDSMGVPLYTEPGRNGGYRVLSNRVLPPVIFSEDEALAIFFAFQSLQYYNSLPFEVDIESASRKLFLALPNDTKPQIENLKSTLIFWHQKRETKTPLLKELIQKTAQKRAIKIRYQSQEQVTDRIIYPIGVYSNEGLWYVPAFDYEKQETRLFRADRITSVEEVPVSFPSEPPTESLTKLLNSYKIKSPIHLYIELSEKGLMRCRDNPYFETNIHPNPDGFGGFIDTIIDKSDLNFASQFIMSLGEDATVIEPEEMRQSLLSFAKKILAQYT